VLPTGMTVQKDNREDTLVNNDAAFWTEALRSGSRGIDDLTNYVVAITNYWTIYSDSAPPAAHVDAHIFNGAWSDGTSNGNWISNGLRIVGLLTTPRYIDTTPVTSKAIFFRSNYIVAYVRSMSGQAGEKFPQTNTVMQDLAFGYRLMPEIAPYTYYEPVWTNYTQAGLSASEVVARSNYWRIASTVQTNLCDLRLTFRWPSFPNGKVGNDRQIFRTVAGGHILLTNNLGMPLWFFEPRTYVKAKLP